ncbi:MAG: S8 family serine peptidase, partial [Thermodesulfovibrionia bacterium]|nr:S8 family serine peptidase [Thermodesulfovibrionia bacterium]
MSIKSLFSPMKNALSYLIASMVIIISSLLAYATDSNADYVPGEIIVKFRQNTDAFSVRALHADAESIMKRGFKKIRVHHMKLSGKLTVEEAVQFYERHPDVEYAEPNFIVAINAIPDDTNFSDLWALHNTGQTGGIYDADIDVPEAWDVATGSRNVVIAVVDTGVAYNHPDISANIWTNTGETSCLDGIDNDGNGYIDDCHGWDFLGNDPDPMDFHGHGTHVAGIIGAMGNNGEG